MATRAASLLGFLLFFVTCHAVRDVTQCHAICIFFTGGELTYERGGDARRKFWKTPKGDQPGRGPTFFWPLKETILLQRSLVIDVIENFDYAPITVKPVEGGRQCMGWGCDIFQKFAVKFTAHGQIIPVNCNQICPPWAAHCCQISQSRTQERHNKNISK